jgi:hypothetical protein
VWLVNRRDARAIADLNERGTSLPSCLRSEMPRRLRATFGSTRAAIAFRHVTASLTFVLAFAYLVLRISLALFEQRTPFLKSEVTIRPASKKKQGPSFG